jgi:hypothetical protein
LAQRLWLKRVVRVSIGLIISPCAKGRMATERFYAEPERLIYRLTAS